MKTKFRVTILLVTTTVSLFSTNIFNQSTNAENIVTQSEASNSAATYSKDRINFYCGEIVDRDGDENIPATIAYVPQRKANVSIIAWKSNYIPQWDAQRRCETVSPKFQSFYENGRLKYLTTGENKGYPIICAAVERQPCQAEDQLFQVKASNDPKAVLEELTGIIEGTASEPIYQSSGQKIYVSIEELLNAAPVIEDLTSN